MEQGESVLSPDGLEIEQEKRANHTGKEQAGDGLEVETHNTKNEQVQSCRMLGAGASSVVWLVGQRQVEKRYKSSDDFLNERAIYAILGQHQRLVPIHSVGCDILIMDWVENGDLACFIKSHAEISQRYKYQWVKQIAESFNLLHRHRISHCDSKLKNFLVDREYNLKICDFASSHNYRAPSQDPAIQPPRYRRTIDDFDETIFNPADDIFAFGSICYELVTGGPLYPDLDDDVLWDRFTHKAFPGIEGLRFGTIIKGCWMGTLNSFELILNAIEKEMKRS